MNVLMFKLSKYEIFIINKPNETYVYTLRFYSEQLVWIIILIIIGFCVARMIF